MGNELSDEGRFVLSRNGSSSQFKFSNTPSKRLPSSHLPTPDHHLPPIHLPPILPSFHHPNRRSTTDPKIVDSFLVDWVMTFFLKKKNFFSCFWQLIGVCMAESCLGLAPTLKSDLDVIRMASMLIFFLFVDC